MRKRRNLRNDITFTCLQSSTLKTPKVLLVSNRRRSENDSSILFADNSQLPSPTILNENDKLFPPTPLSLLSKFHDKVIVNQVKTEYITPNSHMNNQSCSSCDRFIPNRSHLRTDLCRASILDAEKRRCYAIEKKISGKKIEKDSLTPLENEFRLRMRNALLDIPMNEFVHPESGRKSFSCKKKTDNLLSTPQTLPLNLENNFSSNITSRGYPYNMAYASLSDLEENMTCIDGPFSNSDCDDSRIFSFRSNNSSIESSFTSIPTKKGICSSTNHSCETPLHLPIRASALCPVAPDPYSHDQLHVLQRTKIDFSSDCIDPVSIAEHEHQSLVKKVGRKINASPTRILDAPMLIDDYYLNLLSWGSNNILAVALGNSVYLWDPMSGDTKKMFTLPGSNAYVTSVQWSNIPEKNNYLAVGTNEGPTQLWDTKVIKKVRKLRGHSSRVSSLSWNHNTLSTGGRDSFIIHHDPRCYNNIVSSYTGHTHEVCGLKWNDDGCTLASGGNDNYLCLWDAAMSRRNSKTHGRIKEEIRSGLKPRLILTEHDAAVKALAWCPFHRGLLASGGGKEDKSIKFWNSNFGTLQKSIDTGSQVCSLLWSKHNRELCSSHGYSDNQLILWRYPAMTKIQEFKSHTARVLHMDQNPDGSCIVSAAADETLQFWDVFGSPLNQSHRNSIPFGGIIGQQCLIR